MATQTIITCDMHGDGITQAQTVRFGIDGEEYAIDLCDAHANELRGVLTRYIETGKPASGRASSSRSSGGRRPAQNRQGQPRRADLSEVRAWARAQGYEVSDRGRIPAAILTKYDGRSTGRGGKRSK